MSMRVRFIFFGCLLSLGVILYSQISYNSLHSLRVKESANERFGEFVHSLEEQIDKLQSRLEKLDRRNLSDQLHYIRMNFADRANCRREVASLLSHQLFRVRFPKSKFPVYTNGVGEVVVAPKQSVDGIGERHVDHYLCSLAEYGIERSEKIFCTNGTQVSIGQLLNSSKRMVSRDQELEWTTAAFLLLMPDPQEIWTNRFDEACSINYLLDVLLSKRNEECACGGAHRLYTLSLALKIDMQNQFLGSSRRAAIRNVISMASGSLEQSQTVVGGWTSNWYTGDSAIRPFEEMIVQTGHHLEWISICPAELKPKAETVIVACRFFLESVDELSEMELQKYYCGISHGVCGMTNIFGETRQGLQRQW